MWIHLEPHSAKLEQVFMPLRDRATEFDRMWSIAELGLAEDEVEWLRSWFDFLTPESTENWVKSILFAKLEGNASATYRQMFGALLICVGAEVCREESTEGSVWPTIRNILPRAHPLRRQLFLSNGQPSPLTKEVIADAVAALNLRSAMDIEGTQQWFVTIKLQFGFTYRGAKGRLAEWLVNLGRPHAVQYLEGDSDFSELSSDSFQSLWRALKQYRRGLIEEAEAETTLRRNPWVKSHWIEDLLKEARSRIATLGTGIISEHSVAIEEAASTEEPCPVTGVELDWSPGTAPRFSFRLNRNAIEDLVVADNVTELDFYVDGMRLCRWLRQRDGAWSGAAHIYAEPDKDKARPNFDPRTFVVQTRSGEVVAEWDPADSGLLAEVLVFELDSRRMVKAGFERLRTNTSYAIICDRKCEVDGCEPDDVFEQNGISRKVLHVGPPLSENLRVCYRDFILWQPLQREDEQQRLCAVTLLTPKNEVRFLHDRSKLLLEGLPEDAESVELLIHTKTHEVYRHSGRWQTVEQIMLTPELVAKLRRMRVRFRSDGRTFTRTPRCAFNLLGAAMLRHKRDSQERLVLESLKRGTTINRSEGTVFLRVWTPGESDGGSVFEGGYLAGRLRHGKIKLQDLAGHGGALQIVNDGERHSLDIGCVDTGCVAGFWPAMLGTEAQLGLLADKQPSDAGDDGYLLFEWKEKKNHRATLSPLASSEVQASSTERLWRLRYSSNPLAIALTWKGAWLGAHWNLETIGYHISRRGELRVQDFWIMKWLRVPVLHPTLVDAVKKVVLQTPCRFLEAWLSDDRIPTDVRPHEHILGLDSVIRHFLWNDFPLAHAAEAISLYSGREDANHEERLVNQLARLADISPILLWKGMEQSLLSQKHTFLSLLDIFTRAQVGLSSDSSKQQLDYRLQGAAAHVFRATGICRDRLDKILSRRFKTMLEKSWHLVGQDAADLFHLGETHSGRKYLSARMGLHWLQIARS